MPLALNVCVTAPDACASTLDYGAFLRERTYAPLYVASGCLCAFSLLKLDLGHYEKTARSATFLLCYALFWLFVVTVDTTRTLLHAPMTQPGALLLGYTAIALLALAVAAVGDALLNPSSVLHPYAPWTTWLRRFAEAALLAAAPPLAAAYWQSVCAALGALAATFALVAWLEALGARRVAASACAIAVLWLGSLYFYASAFLVVTNALLYVAFLLVAAGRTRASAVERSLDKAHVTTLVETPAATVCGD